MNVGSHEVLNFGPFTLNIASRRLYQHGVPVTVSASGVGILLALLEQPGAIISKYDLIKRVWGSSPVSENALHVQIAALRKLVGGPTIATHFNAGYRFAGELRPARAEGPAAEPQPLQTAEPLPTAEPLQDASHPGLLGREIQLRDLCRRLQEHRFVTLTGPGGVGKTSLAHALMKQARADFPDGAWFVELAQSRDPGSVPEIVKAALRIEGGFNRRPLDDVIARLQSARAVLVLDNCEHIMPAVSEFAETIFARSPLLTLIATSRQPLACTGEHTFAVPPLEVPERNVASARQARKSPAFRLFVDHIAARDPYFRVSEAAAQVAARICRNLDGLPLALEIAAGWASVLGLETLEAKLGLAPIGLRHARVTAPPRHHDLRAALGWSYTLLRPGEQAVLRHVAVFAHAFTLLAAESVAAGDARAAESLFADLGSLVQKSLIVSDSRTNPPTYRLLETTRAFALEKLRETGEEETARLRHARHLLALLTAAENERESNGSADWLERYGPLVAEIRGCLHWALEGGGELGVGLAIAGMSWPVWRELSLRVEGARWIELAVQRVRADTQLDIQAHLQFGLAMMYSDVRWTQAHAGFENAAALYRRVDDQYRLGRALQNSAFTLFLRGDAEGAERRLDEARALLESRGSRRALAVALDVQLMLLAHRHAFDMAIAAGRRAVRIYEAIGCDRSALTVRNNIMEVALCKGDFATAIADGSELAARLRDTPHASLRAMVLVNLVAALVRAGDFAEALGVALLAAPQMPNNRPLCTLLDHLALRCAMLGRLEDAALVAGYADYAYASSELPRQPVEQIASEWLGMILGGACSAQELRRIRQDGELLSEADAWNVAVRPQSAVAGLARADAV